MAKRPAILFYTGDWIKDAALRSCSVGARGMWVDMMCYMHDCEPYGYLKVGNKVILIVNLAAMVGLTLEIAEGYLNELLDAGVCQKNDDGVIFSKRMVRDEDIRTKRASGGTKGGNPNLKKQPIKPKKTTPSEGYPSLEDEDVNVNEDVSKNNKGTPPEFFTPPHPIATIDVEQCKVIYFSQQNSRARELAQMASSLDVGMLSEWVEAFNRRCILTGEAQRTFNEWMKHLNNWLPKQDKNVNPKTLHINDGIANPNTKNNKPATGANVDIQSSLSAIDAMYRDVKRG